MLTVRKRPALGVLPVVCLLLSMSVLFGLLVLESEVARAYTPHAPIYIDGNAGFTAANGVTRGSGTPSDPYIIEGWEIDASTANGIEIRNTDAHLIVRDSYVHSGGFDFDGIYLYNVTNGAVQNTTVSSNYHGIRLALSNSNILSNNNASNNDYAILLASSDSNTLANNTASNDGHGIDLYFSDSNTLANNNASNNYYGIHLDRSNNNILAKNSALSNLGYGIIFDYSNSNTLANNTASNNYYGISFWFSSSNTLADNNASSNTVFSFSLEHSNNNTLADNTASNNLIGISMDSSCDNTLTDNTMVSSGIIIWGDQLGYWNTHDIDTSNTVNGKPVRYWKNRTAGMVPPGAGEVILANSTNISIKNQNVSDGSVGILLGFSNNNTLADNTVNSNDWDGIRIVSSNNNSIANNTVSSTHSYGIYLRYSNDNILTNNTASNNPVGIYLKYSIGNSAYHNNIVENTYQADDNMGAENSWDDGYPSGGNYWSDYAGLDLYSGPNQDLAGPDGIGDTPYIIDADSIDDFPLMSPSGVSDIIPPTLSIVSPSNGALFATMPITVAGTAADTGGSGLDRVKVRVNGRPWQTASGTSTWNISIDLAPDSNFIEARVWDKASNPSAIESLNVLYDPYPPTVSITSPTEGSWVGASMVGITGTAYDAGGSGLDHVDVSCDGGSTWNTAAGTTAWAYTCTGLAAGANVIHARSFDNAGLESTHAIIMITCDPDEPAVSITSPAEGEMFTSATATAAGTASDAIGSVDRVEVRVNGGPWQTAVGTSSWSISVDLVLGSNLVEARAYDNASNPSIIDSVNVTYATQPGLPRNLTAVAGNGKVILTWEAPASDGASSITNYRVYRGTTSGGESFLVEVGNVLTCEDTDIVEGQMHYYRVSAKNSVGEGPQSNETSAAIALPPPEKSIFGEAWFWPLIAIVMITMILLTLFLMRRRRERKGREHLGPSQALEESTEEPVSEGEEELPAEDDTE